MLNVSSIGKTVNRWCEKPLKALANAKPMNKVNNNYIQDKTKFITGLGVASIVLKDGVGCYMYVTQSLHNKDIPEDKRKFVAALDLANGGLMILMQLLMFFTISNKKVQKYLFDNICGKYFNRAASKGYQAILKNTDLLKDMKGSDFHRVLGGIKKDAKDAFANITALFAATIIGKRVIVPFIATPLADKAKKWICRFDAPDKINSETKNTYDRNSGAIDNSGKKLPVLPQKRSDENYNASSNLLDKFKTSDTEN